MSVERSKKQVLRSTTTNTMISLLRGLVGSGGQAEEPTGVETVRANLSNHRYYCTCSVYGRIAIVRPVNWRNSKNKGYVVLYYTNPIISLSHESNTYISA